MRIGSLLLAICLIGAGLSMSTKSTETTAADKPGKVLRHVVLYKFKDGLPQQQLQEVIDAFSLLPKKIDTVIGFEHGPNVSPEGKSDGLTYCFCVTFRDEKGRAVYLEHPAH